jgi:hypothetical protein
LPVEDGRSYILVTDIPATRSANLRTDRMATTLVVIAAFMMMMMVIAIMIAIIGVIMVVPEAAAMVVVVAILVTIIGIMMMIAIVPVAPPVIGAVSLGGGRDREQRQAVAHKQPNGLGRGGRRGDRGWRGHRRGSLSAPGIEKSCEG